MMARRRFRYFYVFPYWLFGVVMLKAWRCLLKKPEPPLLRGYVRLREGLTRATLNRNRLTSPIPANLKRREEAVEWLYVVLSALDGKASALMRLNGVMLAAAAFLLKSGEGMSIGSSFNHISVELILSIAALSAISIALCLLVVSVDWPFLGLVHETGARLDFTDEVNNLERVSVFRQCVYQVAWMVSLVATSLFVFAFVSQIVPWR
jgi:hypothetical protein